MVVMAELPQNKKRRIYTITWVFLVTALIVFTIIFLNREWLYDWYRNVSYKPTEEMTRIRDELELTEQGKFLFNSAQPVLNEAEQFNSNCRRDESEVAVLGCYTEKNIYIYNITESELYGIRELTTAHELLHARWARMDENEKNVLMELLAQTLETNQDYLEEEVNQYDESERQEELYVRVGTEVKELPEALEKHFAEIFKNQDKVVDFYNKYITVFRNIKTEMELLLNEIDALKIEIEAKTAEYQDKYNQLEADIVSFNSCAEVVGCFSTTGEFNSRRAALLVRQDDLEALNNEINRLIGEYNARINEYNSDVTESRKLQDMINSNSRIERVY